MHHTLPFPATKMKCILALANEDGMRGGTLQGEAGEVAQMNSEKDEDDGAASHSLNPRPCPFVLWTQPPYCQDPQHESMRAYGGRGGSEVNDMKNHPTGKES